MKNPFARYFEVINDPDDFKMLYKIYGQVDLELMLDNYNRLTNKPKSYLQVRCHNGKTSF
jgi:hypothetical protein